MVLEGWLLSVELRMFWAGNVASDYCNGWGAGKCDALEVAGNVSIPL